MAEPWTHERTLPMEKQHVMPGSVALHVCEAWPMILSCNSSAQLQRAAVSGASSSLDHRKDHRKDQLRIAVPLFIGFTIRSSLYEKVRPPRHLLMFVAGLCMQHVSFDWTASCVLLSSRPAPDIVHSLAMPRLGLPSDLFKHVFSSHNSRVHDGWHWSKPAFVQRRCPRKIAKLSMWCEMPGSGLEDFHQSESEWSRDDWWKGRLSVLQSAVLRANTM